MKTVNFFGQTNQRRKEVLVYGGFLSVWVVFWVDFWTGSHFSFYLFYFPSIAFVAWHGNRRLGYLMAVLCALTWYAAQMDGHAGTLSFVTGWNATVRLVNFLFVAWATLLIREKMDRLQKLQSDLSDLLDREKNLSRTDDLTGLLNLRGFKEKLSHERKHSKRYGHKMSLLYIDLDDFKVVNDRYGHMYGDRVLKQVADIIKGEIREIDWPARLGGDEFVVLLPRTGKTEAEVCGERIVRVLKNEPDLPVGVSVGVTTFSTLYDSDEEVIRRADEAMYQAKKAGGSRISHLMS